MLRQTHPVKYRPRALRWNHRKFQCCFSVVVRCCFRIENVFSLSHLVLCNFRKNKSYVVVLTRLLPCDNKGRKTKRSFRYFKATCFRGKGQENTLRIQNLAGDRHRKGDWGFQKFRNFFKATWVFIFKDLTFG